MKFKKILEKLVKSGWTQQELAIECKCGQSTLSDIFSGKTKEPRGLLAIKLVELSKNEGV